ncbi:MAG: hypothetical protein Q8K75_10850 [Chlamydiales bacterium]|nr:hypothetical protein [Chlamydiales bacterium]
MLSLVLTVHFIYSIGAVGNASNGAFLVRTRGYLETISLRQTYGLIYSPSGSFCRLIIAHEIVKALKFVLNGLNPGGKFVFKIDTPKAIREPQEVWRGSWIEKPYG